jgi:hypothetical protein
MLIRVLTASETALTVLMWNVVELGRRCMRRGFHHTVGRWHRSANEENAMLRKLMARTLLWAHHFGDRDRKLRESGNAQTQ